MGVAVLNVAFDASLSTIVLDPAIRNWVLVPICIVMFLQGILRQYVTTLWLTDEPKIVLDTVKKTMLVRRSGRLRANAQFLPPSAYRMRKKYFISEAFRERSAGEAGSGAGADAAPAQDPFAMVGMMKQNVSMILPNILMMGWVSYFFSGFVLVKLPFGLYDRFKSMTQRGIMLKSLDASYVSSMSWYFVCLFGLRGLFSLVLGDGNSASDATRMMADPMAMTGMGGMGGQPAPGQAPDYKAIYGVERTELEILHHVYAVPDAELRLLATAGKH